MNLAHDVAGLDGQVTGVSDSDRLTEVESGFADLTLYQTGPYGAVKRGASNVDELVLKRDNTVVGGCRVWVVTVPGIGGGIAYVKRGPLWQRYDRPLDREDFRFALRALHDRYVKRQGLMLRVAPCLSGLDEFRLPEVLDEEGFRRTSMVHDYETIFADLSHPVDEIWKLLSSEWRNRIRRAEKEGLSVASGNDPRLWQQFDQMYQELVQRKGFHDQEDVAALGLVQQQLAEPQKMQVFVCYLGETPISAVVVSAVGSLGIYIHGATSDAGLRYSGGNLLHWRAIEWLKNAGCTRYDLNGIDRQQNPRGFDFKWRLARRFGSQETVPVWQACESWKSATCVGLGEWMQQTRLRIAAAAPRRPR